MAKRRMLFSGGGQFNSPINIDGVGVSGVSLYVASTGTTDPRGIMSAQYSTGVDGARFHLRKARGTEATPLVIVSGDALGKIFASGYDGANYLATASIEFLSTGTIASTRVPTQILFKTGTDAAPSVLTTALTLNSDQTATFASSAGMTGLKLGTGTPSTSRIIDSIHTVAGSVFWTFVNVNAGTTAISGIRAGNADANTACVVMRANGTGFTTSGIHIQDGGSVVAGSALAGGLVLGTEGTNPTQLCTNGVLRLILAGDGLSLNPVTTDSVKLGEAATLFAQVAATNVFVGGASVGTSGVTVLALKSGTAPSTAPADVLQIYNEDVSAGNAVLSVFQEMAPYAGVGVASTTKIPVRFNGATLYILATTVA